MFKKWSQAHVNAADKLRSKILISFFLLLFGETFLLLYIIYLPFHLLFGFKLLSYYLLSNFDLIFAFLFAILGFLAMMLYYKRKLKNLLEWFAQAGQKKAPFNTEQKREYQEILVSLVNRCSIYVAVMIPAFVIFNGSLHLWFSEGGRSIKVGVLFISLLSGMLSFFLVQERFNRVLQPLRVSLGIYLAGDESRSRRWQSSTINIAIGSIAASLIILVFKYGIDILHNFQNSMALTYYQGLRFDVNQKLIDLLNSENLAKVVLSLPSDLNFPQALPETMYERAISLSLFNTALWLFLHYFLVTVGVISLSIWQVLGESEKLLNFVYQHISKIIRREQPLSQRIAILDTNEVGYLTGYVNILLERVSTMGGMVIQRGAAIKDIFDRLDEVSQNNHQLLDVLNQGVSHIAKKSQQQLQNNSMLSSSLDGLLGKVGEIDNKITKQRKMVSNISQQVNYFSQAVIIVEKLTAQTWEEILRLVSMVKIGERSVRNLVAAMQAIAEASVEIEKIVEAITRIAAQTSMLSMNAAIEAAHAGDYGSGFAVVAQEVRTLSESASEQSLSIRKEIKILLQQVEDGLQLSELINQDLESINSNIGPSRELVDLIAQAMKRQSSGAHEITSAVDNVVSVSRQIQNWTQKQDLKSKEIQNNIVVISGIGRDIQTDTINMQENLGAIRESVKDFDKTLVESHNNIEKLTTDTQVIFGQELEKK